MPTLKNSKALKKDSLTQLSSEERDLLDVIAEIIAFDILKKREDNSKEDSND